MARRTQEDRREETRAKLLSATIDSLCDLGYAKTSTTEVVKRAGVSRGALTHHFPAKSDLVGAATEALFDQRLTEFRAAFPGRDIAAHPGVAAIDMLWGTIDGPTYHAWLELVIASRTDPRLATTVSDVLRRFHKQVNETFAELFPDSALHADGPGLDALPSMAFAFLDGLAIRKLADPEDESIEEGINLLKMLAIQNMPAQ